MGYRQATRLLCFGDIFQDTPHISAPTLVMCGSADTVTPEEGCRLVANGIEGAVYKTLPGLGHASYVEAPALFNDFLGEFLGNTPVTESEPGRQRPLYRSRSGARASFVA